MNPADYKLLIVDDEPDTLEFLQYNLLKAGYQVFAADGGRKAIKVAEEVLPHLILLDVSMTEMDGIETCTELRKIEALKQCIILFLTARGEDYTQIAGFEAGADDYVTKPVKPKILLCRIAAHIKRVNFTSTWVYKPANENKDTNDDLVIDRERYVVIKGEKEMVLPRKEFELLSLLYLKPNKVITREDILNSVWGNNLLVDDRTIDVHIRKLREKIGNQYIRTVKGVGYKFVE